MLIQEISLGHDMVLRFLPVLLFMKGIVSLDADTFI